VNFLRRLALQEKKLVTARVSMLLKSRASPDMLPFSLYNKKSICNSAHEQTHLSNDNIDSVLRHRKVSRAKGLSEPTRNNRSSFQFSTADGLKITVLPKGLRVCCLTRSEQKTADEIDLAFNNNSVLHDCRY